MEAKRSRHLQLSQAKNLGKQPLVVRIAFVVTPLGGGVVCEYSTVLYYSIPHCARLVQWSPPSCKAPGSWKRLNQRLYPTSHGGTTGCCLEEQKTRQNPQWMHLQTHILPPNVSYIGSCGSGALELQIITAGSGDQMASGELERGPLVLPLSKAGPVCLPNLGQPPSIGQKPGVIAIHQE